MSSCTHAMVIDHANGHDVGYRCSLKNGHKGQHHIFTSTTLLTDGGSEKDLGGELHGIRQVELALLERGWKVKSYDLCNLARLGHVPCTLYVPNRPSESLWRTSEIGAVVEWFEANWKGERLPVTDGPFVDRDGVLAICEFKRSALEYWHLRGALKPTAYLRLGRGRPTPIWAVSDVASFNEQRGLLAESEVDLGSVRWRSEVFNNADAKAS